MANKWLQHVKQVKAQNKNLQLKEVLQLAKQSYKKQKQQGGGSFADNASPVDAAPVKEDFGHAGGDEKEEELKDGPVAQAGGKKSRKNRKNRKNRNNKNNNQQGGKRRSRKNKGKKSKRRAAGKKARRTRRRRRR